MNSVVTAAYNNALLHKITLPTITHFFVSFSGNYDIYKKLHFHAVFGKKLCQITDLG